MRRRTLALFFLLLLVLLYLGREAIFLAAGSYLVKTDTPLPADVAIVLGGDETGGRVLTGCRLLKEGLVPKVWTSGELRFYNHSESELSREYAVAHGCPADRVEALHFDVDSTRDEAAYITDAMRKAGIKHFLLITSNYHTRRAGNLFRQYSQGLQFEVVAADQNDFSPTAWWKSRRTRKIFFFEWLKTITVWIED